MVALKGGGRHLPHYGACLTLAVFLLLWGSTASAQDVVQSGATCTAVWNLTAYRVYVAPGASVDPIPWALAATIPVATSWPVSVQFPCPATLGDYVLTLAGVGANGQSEGARSYPQHFTVAAVVPTAFHIGASVQPTTRLNVRQAAGITSPVAGPPQATGALGVILAGPTVVTGTTWWQIQWAALTGWSAEPFLTVGAP